MQSTKTIRLSAWAAVFLLFVFYLTRIHNLLALPVFLDEASHITRAQFVWQDKPLYLLTTGKALAPYMMALFWPFVGQLFIGRYVVILIELVGIASCYAVGRELYSRNAGLLGMVLWIICPQLMFFERMALVDTTFASMGLFTLWIAIRMVRSGRWQIAILCGVGLFLCAFAKLTGLVFFPIPILAALLVKSRAPWIDRARQVFIAYAAAVLLLIGPVVYVNSAGEDPIRTNYGLITFETDTLPKRIQTNSEKIYLAERTYFSYEMLMVMALSLGLGGIFATRSVLILLPLAMAPLAAVIAAAASLWLRYASPAAPFMLLLTAIGLTAFADELVKWKIPPVVRVMPWVVVAIWAIAIGVPFQLTAYSNPAKLPLPQGDRSEYIEWIPSGYGIQNAVAYLRKLITRPTVVIVTAANCDGARMYVPYGSPLRLVCPGIDWGGGNQNIVDEIQKQADTEGQAIVLGEDAPIVREDQLPKPFTILERFPRPNPYGYYTVKVYRILSNAEGTGSEPINAPVVGVYNPR